MPYEKVAIGSLDIDAVDLAIGSILAFADPAGRPSELELVHLKKRMVLVEQSDHFGVPLIDTGTATRKAMHHLLIGPAGTGRTDRHKAIPKEHGHSDLSIRGGGYFTIEQNTLRLEGNSIDFGSIPALLRRKLAVQLASHFREKFALEITPDEAFLDAEQSPYIDAKTKPYWLRYRQVLEEGESLFRGDMIRMRADYEASESRFARDINAMYFREAH